MSKNVKVNGVTYNGVNSVKLQAADGGEVIFYDSAPTTPQESDINFWDYDGTLLYAWTLAELAGKTELPPLPSHDGLICQGWNWTLQDIKDAGRELDIGALYITDDGKTRLYVDVDTETWETMRVNFWQSASNCVTINWGDGSAEETVDASGETFAEHAYQQSGKYRITLLPEMTGTMRLGKEGTALLGTTVDSVGAARNSQLLRVEIGTHVEQTGANCFHFATNLETITYPSGTVAILYSAFMYASRLQCLVVPALNPARKNMQNMARSAASLCVVSFPNVELSSSMDYWAMDTALRRAAADIYNAYGARPLESVSIAVNNGTVGLFTYCQTIQTVNIPAAATAFSAEAFRDCYSLRKVMCLGNIESIPAQTFLRCYALKIVDLTHCTAVPTLAATNAFGNTNPELKIRVPAALADEWKAATNWSSLADHIVGIAQGGGSAN